MVTPSALLGSLGVGKEFSGPTRVIVGWQGKFPLLPLGVGIFAGLCMGLLQSQPLEDSPSCVWLRESLSMWQPWEGNLCFFEGLLLLEKEAFLLPDMDLVLVPKSSPNSQEPLSGHAPLPETEDPY